jgi:hypothetical protein
MQMLLTTRLSVGADRDPAVVCARATPFGEEVLGMGVGPPDSVGGPDLVTGHRAPASLTDSQPVSTSSGGWEGWEGAQLTMSPTCRFPRTGSR